MKLTYFNYVQKIVIYYCFINYIQITVILFYIKIFFASTEIIRCQILVQDHKPP